MIDSIKQPRQAGTEIEITPEMIEAGAEAVLEYQAEMSVYEARNISRAVLRSALAQDAAQKNQTDRLSTRPVLASPAKTDRG